MKSNRRMMYKCKLSTKTKHNSSMFFKFYQFKSVFFLFANIINTQSFVIIVAKNVIKDINFDDQIQSKVIKNQCCSGLFPISFLSTILCAFWSFSNTNFLLWYIDFSAFILFERFASVFYNLNLGKMFIVSRYYFGWMDMMLNFLACF